MFDFGLRLPDFGLPDSDLKFQISNFRFLPFPVPCFLFATPYSLFSPFTVTCTLT